MAQDQYVYFLYSEQQYKKRKELEEKVCRKFVPGIVILNGQKKKFTEMSKKSTNIYPDTSVVAEGYKSNMNYTTPSTVAAKK